jgi:hypothetical protein
VVLTRIHVRNRLNGYFLVPFVLVVLGRWEIKLQNRRR